MVPGNFRLVLLNRLRGIFGITKHRLERFVDDVLFLVFRTLPLPVLPLNLHPIEPCRDTSGKETRVRMGPPGSWTRMYKDDRRQQTLTAVFAGSSASPVRNSPLFFSTLTPPTRVFTLLHVVGSSLRVKGKV